MQVLGWSNSVSDPQGHSEEKWFAERVRKVRAASGLTQAAAAERIGVSLRTYASYEGGSKSPELKRIPDIARAFGVSVGELLDEEKPREISPREALKVLSRLVDESEGKRPKTLAATKDGPNPGLREAAASVVASIRNPDTFAGRLLEGAPGMDELDYPDEPDEGQASPERGVS